MTSAISFNRMIIVDEHGSMSQDRSITWGTWAGIAFRYCAVAWIAMWTLLLEHISFDVAIKYCLKKPLDGAMDSVFITSFFFLHDASISLHHHLICFCLLLMALANVFSFALIHSNLTLHLQQIFAFPSAYYRIFIISTCLPPERIWNSFFSLLFSSMIFYRLEVNFSWLRRRSHFSFQSFIYDPLLDGDNCTYQELALITLIQYFSWNQSQWLREFSLETHIRTCSWCSRFSIKYWTQLENCFPEVSEF